MITTRLRLEIIISRSVRASSAFFDSAYRFALAGADNRRAPRFGDPALKIAALCRFGG